MTPRGFPSPWSVEETDVCFVVRDHNGQALAYVYFEEEPGRRWGSGHKTSEHYMRGATHSRRFLPTDQIRGSHARIGRRGASESICLSAVGPWRSALCWSDTQRCRGASHAQRMGDKAKPPVLRCRRLCCESANDSAQRCPKLDPLVLPRVRRSFGRLRPV